MFRRGFGGAVLACLAAAVALAAPPPKPPAPRDFPPPPPREALVAINDDEREAGAVVLEDVTELSGEVRVGMTRLKGSSMRLRRVRYAVLDASGAERLGRHAFFGVGSAEAAAVRGRTIGPDGAIHQVDPARDIRTLQEQQGGRAGSFVKTVMFPRVEPGAVLDLAWVEASSDLPELELVTLQGELPVRSLRVESRGVLCPSAGWNVWTGPTGLGAVRFCWVPFFVGPPPERAHARLDADFNLVLTLRDVPPLPDEPYAPPHWRAEWMLGLMPVSQSTRKRDAEQEWRKNFVLFGPDAAALRGPDGAVSADIDPRAGLIRIDELGLQPPPEWTSRADWMAADLQGLRVAHERFDAFLRDATGAESEAEVAAIASPDLPWRERARLLWRHARRRVKPDPAAPRERATLRELLAAGRGSSRDACLYYGLLLRRAGIPSRMLFVLPRTGIPYQPIFTTWAVFSPAWHLEAGPAGEEPLIADAGDPFEPFGGPAVTLPGALAFREPDDVGRDWSLVRIPPDADVGNSASVAMTATLPAPGAEATVAMRATLCGNSAWRLRAASRPRGGNETEADADARARTAIAELALTWASVVLPDPPRRPLPEDIDEPVAVDLDLPWAPETSDVGGSWLVPALPRAALLENALVAARRRQPLWLPGGRWELSMTWRLPPGASPAELPPPRSVEGPGGLRFTLETTAGDEGGALALTTRVDARLPHVLPASDYEDARRFFDELEAAGRTRVLVTGVPAP